MISKHLSPAALQVGDRVFVSGNSSFSNNSGSYAQVMSFPFLSFIRVISRLTNSRSISPSADKFTPSSSTPTFLLCSLLSLTPPMFSPFIQGLHLHRWILDCLRIFSFSITKGASLGVPFFTAYKALILRAKTKPGETVLVHGARFLHIKNAWSEI